MPEKSEPELPEPASAAPDAEALRALLAQGSALLAEARGMLGKAGERELRVEALLRESTSLVNLARRISANLGDGVVREESARPDESDESEEP